jgi:two-component system response regulator MprA
MRYLPVVERPQFDTSAARRASCESLSSIRTRVDKPPPHLNSVPVHVLVVDDDAPVRRMLERTLGAEGNEVRSVADGPQALIEVERSVPDLVILDVAMPGMDGLAVCRRLRSKGIATPILLLTARDAVADRVAGLDAGADDYLVKPFATSELAARVRALTRRHHAPQLAFDDLALDPATRIATRGGSEIALTAREAELLELLLRNAPAVVSRELAIEEIWGGAAVENIVDRYVGYLRRKLGEPDLIRTVRGVGFTLQR